MSVNTLCPGIWSRGSVQEQQASEQIEVEFLFRHFIFMYFTFLNTPLCSAFFAVEQHCFRQLLHWCSWYYTLKNCTVYTHRSVFWDQLSSTEMSFCVDRCSMTYVTSGDVTFSNIRRDDTFFYVIYQTSEWMCVYFVDVGSWAYIDSFYDGVSQ